MSVYETPFLAPDRRLSAVLIGRPLPLVFGLGSRLRGGCGGMQDMHDMCEHAHRWVVQYLTGRVCRVSSVHIAAACPVVLRRWYVPFFLDEREGIYRSWDLPSLQGCPLTPGNTEASYNLSTSGALDLQKSTPRASSTLMIVRLRCSLLLFPIVFVVFGAGRNRVDGTARPERNPPGGGKGRRGGAYVRRHKGYHIGPWARRVSTEASREERGGQNQGGRLKEKILEGRVALSSHHYRRTGWGDAALDDMRRGQMGPCAFWYFDTCTAVLATGRDKEGGEGGACERRCGCRQCWVKFSDGRAAGVMQCVGIRTA
nr:hypothetical protein CFP56_11036 [Quercus suber]